LPGTLVRELAGHRETLTPYLVPLQDRTAREQRERFWAGQLAAGRVYDRAHALFLWGQSELPEYEALMRRLATEWPDYAPARFLRRETELERKRTPRFLATRTFPVLEPDGRVGTIEISAVGQWIGEARGVVSFVDNRVREIFGENYLDAPGDDLEALMLGHARRTLDALDRVYEESQAAAGRSGRAAPPRDALSRTLRDRIASSSRAQPAR
jgi:hypothetical protein